MMMPLAALFLSSQMVVAVADGPPNLKFEPGCRHLAQLDLTIDPSYKNCVQEEKSARTQLSREWAKFSAADRTRCVAETNMTPGVAPSYVEVLECLNMARDVENTAGTNRKR
ncbi:hypothetical protein [Microvirga terricola]|uniref:Lysozyme inhibitor LprI N-terminal domain-containing protein n=1 Tax=Microvirga terricola TaxID=2719797 RepID=A0ABX0V8F2_9HYPH|nr:hypothetical protein [Microvirga terricola]NIX76135.1 hypothetical protein [Microvirga terricola]